MSELSEYTNSELLSQLVDGELDSGRESTLYGELSGDENLRLEFRELMLMKETVRYDTEAFAPPVDATAGVFHSLGFTSTLEAGKNTAGIASVAGGSFLNSLFSRKFLAPVLTAVLASLISFAVLSYYYEHRISEIKQSIAVVTSVEKPADGNPANRIASESSINGNTIINRNTANTGFALSPCRSRHNALNASSLAALNAGLAGDRLEPRQVITRPSIVYVDPASMARPDALYASNPAAAARLDAQIGGISLNPPMASARLSNKNYSIRLRGMTAASFPHVGVPTQSNAFFNNMSLGLFFVAGAHSIIGLEAGQEPFGQSFANTSNGISSKVEQNPVIYWIGGSYAYMFGRMGFLAGMQPFVQGIAGFTELGPIAKTIIGLQYQSDGGFGTMLGAEGTLLLYQNQQTRYTSRKLGLTYGLFYNF